MHFEIIFLGSRHPLKFPQARNGNRREAHVCGGAGRTAGGIQTAEGGMMIRSDLAALLALAFVAAAMIGHLL
jgi:hypothetical protein